MKGKNDMEVKDLKINLKACRANSNMDQKEWANKIGVTLNTISNWENGKGEPSLSQLRIISELSKIPMDCIVMTIDSF